MRMSGASSRLTSTTVYGSDVGERRVRRVVGDRVAVDGAGRGQHLGVEPIGAAGVADLLGRVLQGARTPVHRWTAIAPDVNHASFNGVSAGSAQSWGSARHRDHTFPNRTALPGA